MLESAFITNQNTRDTYSMYSIRFKKNSSNPIIGRLVIGPLVTLEKRFYSRVCLIRPHIQVDFAKKGVFFRNFSLFNVVPKGPITGGGVPCRGFELYLKVESDNYCNSVVYGYRAALLLLVYCRYNYM